MTLAVGHIAREQLTVTNAVKTLTADTITDRVVYGEVQVQAYPVRVTFDGSTAPLAATTGTLWNPNSIHRVWTVAHLKNLKFIRESSDATLVVDYYGEG